MNQVFLFHGNAEPQWLAISSAPLMISGNHIGAVVSFSDITQRKINEQVISDSENHLRELNATKDKLFSIISHDLRGPFCSLIGFSELLTEKIRNRDLKGIEMFSRMIHDSSWRAMDLLSNLLEWSKIQTDKIKFSPGEIDISKIIGGVIELLKPAAIQKSISISKYIPEHLFVHADNSMINAVIRNLISNAIKFTKPEGRVIVSANQQDDKLLIEVIDNGIGIDKATIDNLFEDGTNVSTPGTQNEPGTGLGFIICKEFVAIHGGELWAESEVGKGSKFSFTLPLISEI
jgi:signal transduction histidine kinase